MAFDWNRFWESPAFVWYSEDDSETIKLKEENRKLKMMIRKLIEQGIKEEKDVLEWK